MRLFIFAVFWAIVAVALPLRAEEELNPEFPVILGEAQIGKDWSLFLPVQMNRQVKDGGLVLWRAGMTFWISLYDNESDTRDFVARLKRETAPAARVMMDEQRRYHYLYVFETAGRDRAEKYPEIVAYAIADDSFMLVGIYCDDQQAAQRAYEVLGTIKRASPGAGPVRSEAGRE